MISEQVLLHYSLYAKNDVDDGSNCLKFRMQKRWITTTIWIDCCVRRWGLMGVLWQGEVTFCEISLSNASHTLHNLHDWLKETSNNFPRSSALVKRFFSSSSRTYKLYHYFFTVYHDRRFLVIIMASRASLSNCVFFSVFLVLFRFYTFLMCHCY